MAVSFKEGSVSFRVLRAVFDRYAALERCFFYWLCHSRICRAFFNLAGRFHLWMRFSFFARFSRAGSVGHQQVISASIIVGSLRRLWCNFTAAFRACWQYATCRRLAVTSGFGYFFSPAKMGVFILAAVITDVVILILFGKAIALVGWVALAVVLFAGFCVLSCPASWDELKDTSFFFRRRA